MTVNESFDFVLDRCIFLSRHLVAMAAVDSFSLLLREVCRSCGSYVEMLAFIGALYMAKTSFTFANDTYTLIRLHFIPRLVRRADLVKQYGTWAVVTGERLQLPFIVPLIYFHNNFKKLFFLNKVSFFSSCRFYLRSWNDLC